MAINTTQSKLHWTYFIALEKDLETLARYIEFTNENMDTFSLELAHLLMAASSEVDVVAKLICERLEPNSPRRNIDHYREVLNRAINGLPDMQVSISRYGLQLKPWANWSEGRNPDWWRGYNNVKHERNLYFNEATLKNALNAMAALLCLVFHYYQLDIPIELQQDQRAKETTRHLVPDTTLMQLDGDYYYANLIG